MQGTGVTGGMICSYGMSSWCIEVMEYSQRKSSTTYKCHKSSSCFSRHHHEDSCHELHRFMLITAVFSRTKMPRLEVKMRKTQRVNISTCWMSDESFQSMLTSRRDRRSRKSQTEDKNVNVKNDVAVDIRREKTLKMMQKQELEQRKRERKFKRLSNILWIYILWIYCFLVINSLVSVFDQSCFIHDFFKTDFVLFVQRRQWCLVFEL